MSGTTSTGSPAALPDPTRVRDALVHDLAATTAEVLLPGDPAFAAALPGYNLAVRHEPEAVVRARSAADVAACVRAAGALGLRVAVRSTGHSAAPAAPGTVLLDVGALADVVVDPGAATATVGAGTRWQQVLDAAAPHGLGGLCGSAPDVGVVGYTLGGGMGPLARAYGFAADHVVALDVVLPTGEPRTVTAASDPDLFWALRGGGGAFGVVTSMTFGLVPVTTLRAGATLYDVADAPAVLRRWRDVTATAPETLGTSVARLNLPPDPSLPPPLRGRSVLAVRFTHLGDPAETDSLLAALRGPETPVLDTVGDLPYTRLGEIHMDPPDPVPALDRGGLLRELPDAAVDAFLAATAPGTPVLVAELRLLGGAVARGAEGAPSAAASVAGRDAAYSLFTATLAPPVMPEWAPQALQGVLDALAPWSTGGALLNFAGPRDEAAAHALRAAWGEDYDRLVALRRENDPAGVLDPTARWDVVAGDLVTAGGSPA